MPICRRWLKKKKTPETQTSKMRTRKPNKPMHNIYTILRGKKKKNLKEGCH